MNDKVKQVPEAPSPLTRSRSHVQARQLAHEVKNFMSVLLLGLANLEREGDHWKISAREREVFEDAILEINRLVETVVDLTRNNTAAARAQEERLRPPQDPSIDFALPDNHPLQRNL